MKYYMPTRFISDDDVIEKNKETILAFGKKALLVTGKNSAIASGALADVEKILKEAGKEFVLYDGIRQNPTMVSCIEAGRLANEKNCDFVIGIGGGSVLDASKVAAVSAKHPELDEAGIYALQFPNGRLPLVLVGLSAGTGSEVTEVAVLTNKEKRKKSIHVNALYADLALGDPKYLTSLNREFTVSTGIDALAHLVEAYYSKAGNDISKAMAKEGIVKALPVLKKLAEEKELDIKDRKEIYDASIIGGLAINVTGTVFPHNVGYLLTENYGIPHGFACAVFMPDLFAYESEVNKDYTDELFYHIGWKQEEFIALVEKLLPKLDIVMSEEEIDALLPRWHQNKSVMNTMGNADEYLVRKVLASKFVR